MSSNIQSASVTNEISQMIAEYNPEVEMLEIASSQYYFSDLFDEIVGINIQTLEEKQNADQSLSKIKLSIRKTGKSVRKGNKFSAFQVNRNTMVGGSSFKKGDFNNDYFEMPMYQENKGEWQQEEQEAQVEQLAIPQQLISFQSQDLLLQDQQDIIRINKVDLKITRNISNLNKNSKDLSSSSSSLISN
ncbi:unnamed protein product [Paramecium octaurelia]|uniref:Uncharacterized protein n=1 Tax=Paramecium octaurelia TaxID=43137 RepID=A0A8S1XMQ4_PAROT|nr:unnamed protein product [Paramecium octaurelia]